MLIVLHLNTETLISLSHVSRKINYMIWMNNREAGTIPPDFPITISNRLVPSSLPPLSLHCAVKNEMCWWKFTKGAEANWKAKGEKRFLGKRKYSSRNNKPRHQENLCQVATDSFLFLSLSSASWDEITHKYFLSDKRHFHAQSPSLVLQYQVSSRSSRQFY